MRDELQQRVRHAFEQLDKAAPSHDMPTSAQLWPRLQFRLAYQPRTHRHDTQTNALWVALYILGFLMWLTWSGWLSVSLLAVLASAGSAAVFFLVRVSRSFRT